MGGLFKQDDVFPIIARVIEQEYKKKKRFITHDEIVEGFLKDSEGSVEINKAHKKSGERTMLWIAGNMIAWFSQRITMELSDYAGCSQYYVYR